MPDKYDKNPGLTETQRQLLRLYDQLREARIRAVKLNSWLTLNAANPPQDWEKNESDRARAQEEFQRLKNEITALIGEADQLDQQIEDEGGHG